MIAVETKNPSLPRPAPPTFEEHVASWSSRNAPTQLPRCGSTRLGDRKVFADPSVKTTIYEIVQGTPERWSRTSAQLLERLTKTRPLQPPIDPIRMATVRTYSVLGSVSPPSEVTWDMGTQVPILVSSEGLTDVRREDTPVIGVGGKHVYKSTGYCPWLECRVVIDDSGTTVNSLIGTKTLEVAYRLDKIVTSNDGKITRATFVHRACKRTALHFLRQLDGPNADLMVLRNSPLGK